MTADFKQQMVDCRKIDSGGVTVIPAGAQQPAVVGFDSFLQIDRVPTSQPAAEPFVLHGVAGQRVAGQPAGYKDEQVVWRNALVGEIKLPLKLVRGIVRAGRNADQLDAQRVEDQVLLANGDSIKGIVTDLGTSQIKINSNATEVPIAIDTVACVYFAPAGKPVTKNERAFRVKLADGSVLNAAAVRIDGEEMKLTIADQGERGIALAAVAGIEQLNGPVSWLSSRQPEAIVQAPFFGTLSWPTRMDTTVSGSPIQFDGRTYARGIGVHAWSRIDFVLDGNYPVFRTQYAIAADTRTVYADVTVRIKVDDKVVHEKTHVRAGTISPVVVLDLPREAKKLTLEVDYGDANDAQDHFNWIEPALLKTRPPTTQPAE